MPLKFYSWKHLFLEVFDRALIFVELRIFLSNQFFFFVINRRILDSISFFYSFLFYAIEYIKSNTEKCII